MPPSRSGDADALKRLLFPAGRCVRGLDPGRRGGGGGKPSGGRRAAGRLSGLGRPG
ncbi:hypothetical protein ACRAWD_28580 [Caulobacter segnis]